MISRCFLLAIACVALAACSPEEAPEFCRDHVQFHAEHADTNGMLSVTMTAEGRIESEVRLPVASMGEALALGVLQDVDRVYALQTAADCTAATSTLHSSDGMIVAAYASECGAENKLGQIDVLLFDSLPDLNEVEVTVVTPATQKHFAINRQCESAIFRLE